MRRKKKCIGFGSLKQEWNEVRRIKNKKWVELGYVHWNDNKC